MRGFCFVAAMTLAEKLVRNESSRIIGKERKVNPSNDTKNAVYGFNSSQIQKNKLFDTCCLAEKYCSFPLFAERKLSDSSNKACVEVTKFCTVQHENWKTECIHSKPGQSQLLLPDSQFKVENFALEKTKPEKMTDFASIMKGLENRASSLIRSLKKCTDGRVLDLELYMNLRSSLYDLKKEVLYLRVFNGGIEKVERMLKTPFDILKIYDAAATTLCANNTNYEQCLEFKRSRRVNSQYSMSLLNVLLVG